jgi:hypothetical protein
MAFVQEFEEDENQGQQQQQPGGVVTSGSGSSVIQGNAQASSSSGSAEPKKTRTSGWSNLQNYITANQGNDAAMGQKIAQGIGDTASEVTQAKGSVQGKAQEDIARNTVTDQGVIQGLQTDPTKVSKDSFTSQVGAQYQGPDDVSAYEDYAKGQSARSQLDEKLAKTQTEEGRNALIRGIAGQNYTQGLGNLDQFILSAGQQGKQALQDTRQQYGNTSQDWDNLMGSLNEGFKSARGTTEKTAADTMAAYEQAFGGSTNAIKQAQTRTTETNAQRKKEYGANVAALGDKDAAKRAAAAKRLGIDTAALEYLRGIGFTPQQIASYSGDLNLGNIVDPKQKAQYEALLSLADRESQFSFDPSKAGQQATAVKTDIVNAGKEAKALRDAKAQAVKDANNKRALEFQRLQDHIARGGIYNDEIGKLTGLTKREFELARRGNYGGVAIDPSLLSFDEGSKLNLGDVTTDAERKQWTNLMRVLGNRDTTNFADTQQEGGAVRFSNAQKIRDLIAQGEEVFRQSELARQKADEEAARIRKERFDAVYGDDEELADAERNLAVRY